MEEVDMEDLSELVKEFLRSEEICAVGIATKESLDGGPPSTDLDYALAGARSAVSFAFALDQSLIEPFLSKKDRRAHERDNIRVNTLASGAALNLAKYLEQKGYPSVPLASNNVYRPEVPGGRLAMMPDISLRYLAVRSGIGHFGLSGNVLTPDHGAAVILGAVVTQAELTPTSSLPPEAAYCDQCRLCMASCASGMMSPDEETTVSMGGEEFRYSRRRDYLRCEFVCGGFTGLHPSGQWSTWSPGRFRIPDNDGEFRAALIRGVKANSQWPDMGGGAHHILMGKKLYLTCGNCQLICHPDREERTRRYHMLTHSGAVVQNPDGSLEATTPEKARERFAAMEPQRRRLYEDA
jgi:epoxyqueuosine reductase